jgi:hypothetical protein
MGLGTNSPNGLLALTAASGRLLTLRNSTTGSGSGDGSYLALNGSDFQIANAESANVILYTADTERVRITSVGNMGIGGAPLPTSTGYDGATLHLRQSANSGGSHLRMTNGSTGHTTSDGFYMGYWQDGHLYCYNQEAGHILVGTNGTERFRISSNGNIGINDNSPASLFTINNGTNDNHCLLIKNDNVAAYFGTYGTGHGSYPREVTINGTRTDSGSGPFLRIAGQGGIKFCADLNSERMRITSGGQVNIGGNYTQTSAQLQVYGAGLFENGIRGPVKYTGSYTANSNRDITGFGYGNYIVNIRSSGVYHWNGILMVTMYDTADFGVQTLVSGNYGTSLTASMVNLSAGNGTLRLVFNRDMGTLTVSVTQVA